MALINSPFTFKLNTEGVAELMKSEAMQDVLMSYASQVADNASGDYDVYVGKNRANVSCRNQSTYQQNLETNDLLKAAGEYYD